MQHIDVYKDELLIKLKANREVHKQEYEDACVGYNVIAIATLAELLDSAKNGGYDGYSALSSLHEPVNNLQDYDIAIAMLEMSVGVTVKLSANEFDCYVFDNWDWREMAKLENSSYFGFGGANQLRR